MSEVDVPGHCRCQCESLAKYGEAAQYRVVMADLIYALQRDIDEARNRLDQLMGSA